MGIRKIDQTLRTQSVWYKLMMVCFAVPLSGCATSGPPRVLVLNVKQGYNTETAKVDFSGCKEAGRRASNKATTRTSTGLQEASAYRQGIAKCMRSKGYKIVVLQGQKLKNFWKLSPEEKLKQRERWATGADPRPTGHF